MDYEFETSEEDAGRRLDVFLARGIEEASRSFLQGAIKDGRVTINGRPAKRPSRCVALGDVVAVDMPPPPTLDLVGEDIPLEIVHEDSEVLVVNKPSGMVVHPAPGHHTGTLVHAVLFHCPDFQCGSAEDEASLRPGIVHRLDRFTSGVMVVAKTPSAFDHLSRQAREHTFDRRYLALVSREFKEARGRIDASIGRSLADRSRMSVTPVRGRNAVTEFEVLERFEIASLIQLRLLTGRTHQIRVHLRFAGRPVLGDPIYGVTDYRDWRVGRVLRGALKALEGQALHAELLGFEHPGTGERMSFTAAAPGDFGAVLEALRHWREDAV